MAARKLDDTEHWLKAWRWTTMKSLAAVLVPGSDMSKVSLWTSDTPMASGELRIIEPPPECSVVGEENLSCLRRRPT